MAPGILIDRCVSTPSSPIGRKQAQYHQLEVQETLPEVSALNIRSYTSEEDLIIDIIASLKLSGGCIIRNMFQQSTLDAMENDIRPYLNTTGEADAKRQAFVPCATRMVTGLLSKSYTYASEVVGNRIWRRVTDHFLTSTISNYWHGPQCHTSTSAPQLSTTVAFSVSPGTPAQGLHRDDDVYHTYHSATPIHHLGRDNMVCFFVAGKTCTRLNGATRIVPGSHLWDFSVPPPADCSPSFAYAEMQPGDAFMMLGGVYHGAGANQTESEERLVYTAFATRGYLRQEENQYLANDLEKIRRLPVEVQKFVGFGVSLPFMGWVDMESATKKVLGSEVEDEEFW